MWELERYADLEKRLKKLVKRHRQEVANAFANLSAYLAALRSGLKPQQIIRGYVHSEPSGLRALDQSGPKNPTKELRLYIYPEEDKQLLHVLLIGDKDSQADDIKHCEEFVESLLSEKPQLKRDETDHVQEHQPTPLLGRGHAPEHPAG